MATLLDRCRFNPTAGGVNDFVFSTPVVGFNSPDQAGAVNNGVYKYAAESADLSQWEIGQGTYNSTTKTLVRTKVLYNSSGTGTGAGQSGAGSKINFTANPQVMLVVLAEDIVFSGVCPEHFGAVGDGTTDDTAAVQAAFSNGGKVYGRGTYYVTNTINLVSGTRLENLHLVAGPVAGFTPITHLPLVFGNIVNDVIIDRCTFDISAWTTLPAGASSLRTVHFYRAFDISVTDCAIITTGGAVSFWSCARYRVSGNHITCVQPGANTSGFADGVIDNWVGFDTDIERVVIAENSIVANGWGRWGIMMTGQTYDPGGGQPIQVMDVRYVTIADNVISNTYYDPIWVFGRTATLHGCTITGNVVTDGRIGISVSDALNITITGNVVERMTNEGIYLWSEETGGVTDSVVACNLLRDVGSSVAGQTSALHLDIASANCLVFGNTIAGTTHYYGISAQASTTGNDILWNKITTGRGSTYNVNTTTNNVASGPATANPLMDGTAALGIAPRWAREDHVHPTDTSRAPTTNPIFTGNLKMTTASNGMEIGSTTSANAPYIDFHSSGGAEDYSSRIIATAGTSGTSGTGTLQLLAAILLLPSIKAQTAALGFFGATPVAQPTISGSRGGNAALASLLTSLAALGLIVDGTTA